MNACIHNVEWKDIWYKPPLLFHPSPKTKLQLFIMGISTILDHTTYKRQQYSTALICIKIFKAKQNDWYPNHQTSKCRTTLKYSNCLYQSCLHSFSFPIPFRFFSFRLLSWVAQHWLCLPYKSVSFSFFLYIPWNGMDCSDTSLNWSFFRTTSRGLTAKCTY